MLSLNLLLPEAAWALCGTQPTTRTYPPGSGTDGPDVIEGDRRPNRIDGLGGNDVICGNHGWDELRGGLDNDQLYGGYGNDILDVETAQITSGGVGVQRAWGGPGDDTIRSTTPVGAQSIDEFFGGSGNDILNGGEGMDFLQGEGGRDIIDGGPGSDKPASGWALQGGPGDDLIKAADNEADSVDGGSGFDRCELDPSDTHQNCERVTVLAAPGP